MIDLYPSMIKIGNVNNDADININYIKKNLYEKFNIISD